MIRRRLHQNSTSQRSWTVRLLPGEEEPAKRARRLRGATTIALALFSLVTAWHAANHPRAQLITEVAESASLIKFFALWTAVRAILTYVPAGQARFHMSWAAALLAAATPTASSLIYDDASYWVPGLVPGLLYALVVLSLLGLAWSDRTEKYV